MLSIYIYKYYILYVFICTHMYDNKYHRHPKVFKYDTVLQLPITVSHCQRLTDRLLLDQFLRLVLLGQLIQALPGRRGGGNGLVDKLWGNHRLIG